MKPRQQRHGRRSCTAHVKRRGLCWARPQPTRSCSGSLCTTRARLATGKADERTCAHARARARARAFPGKSSRSLVYRIGTHIRKRVGSLGRPSCRLRLATAAVTRAPAQSGGTPRHEWPARPMTADPIRPRLGSARRCRRRPHGPPVGEPRERPSEQTPREARKLLETANENRRDEKPWQGRHQSPCVDRRMRRHHTCEALRL